MTETTNPLAKHFRQPAIYVKLTSGGKFWKEGSLELPVTGEIPVYPMTVKDEIILKTPDSLINGTSVVQIIQSCCPNIKDAWEMPSVDIDSTLIAIRIASYGATMTITSKCPKCQEEHDYDINLQDVLARIRMPDYNETIATNDKLVIKLKPLNYYQVSKIGNMTFEQEKIIKALTDTSLSEEVRNAEYTKHFNQMIDINNQTVTNCTYSIIADGVEVTDPKFISEYYQNAESSILKKVQEKVKEFADVVNVKSEDATCTSCGNNFKLLIEFDFASFFVGGF